MQYSTVKNWNYSTIKTFSLIGLLIGAFFLFAFSGPLQQQYQLVNKVDINSGFMTSDMLKNVYIINEDKQLIRYDSTGRATGGYNDTRFGELHSVDATSPFNVLLFYKDFSTVVMADSRLNTKTLYKLSTLGMNSVSAACLSFDNYIWVYDSDEAKLKKINTQYEVIQESLDLSSVLGMRPDPNFIIEREDFVFLNDPNLGIICFDIFGNYVNSYPMSGLENFQVIGNNIVFYDGVALRILNYKSIQGMSQEVNSFPLPDADGIKDVKVEKGHLFLRKEGEVHFYKVL